MYPNIPSSRGRIPTTNLNLRARDFKLSIFKEDYVRIGTLVGRIPHAETGGNLFGLWTNHGNAVVLVATGPGQNCKRSTVSFYQDIAYMERVGNMLTGDYPLCHIGEWHSHHQMQLFAPSSGDCNTVQRNYPTGSQGFVLMIANILRDGNVRLSPYKFKDGCSSYEEGEIEVLHVENPFMTAERIIRYINQGKEEKVIYQDVSGTYRQIDSCRPAIEPNDARKKLKRGRSPSPPSRESRSRSRSPNLKTANPLSPAEAHFRKRPTENKSTSQALHIPNPPTDKKKESASKQLRRPFGRQSVTNTTSTTDKKQQPTTFTALTPNRHSPYDRTQRSRTRRTAHESHQETSRVQNATGQWYETEPDSLERTLVFVKSLADDKKTVDITRDTSTLNLTMEFTHHYHKWALDFPSDFPSGTAKLKKTPSLNNSYSFFVEGLGDIHRFITELKTTLQQECTTCKIGSSRCQYNKDTFPSVNGSSRQQETFQKQRDENVSHYNLTAQWYDSEPDTLKTALDFVKSLADDKKTVNMTRDKSTQNLTMEFTHHHQKWALDFPYDFPRKSAKLNENNQRASAARTRSRYSYSSYPLLVKSYYVEATGDITRFMGRLKSTLDRNCITCRINQPMHPRKNSYSRHTYL